MAKDNKEISLKCGKGCNGSCGTNNAVYGLGFVGAVIYFLQQAANFQEGVIGFLKAIVWPAFLVYKAMGLLGM